MCNREQNPWADHPLQGKRGKHTPVMGGIAEAIAKNGCEQATRIEDGGKLANGVVRGVGGSGKGRRGGRESSDDGKLRLDWFPPGVQ